MASVTFDSGIPKARSFVGSTTTLQNTVDQGQMLGFQISGSDVFGGVSSREVVADACVASDRVKRFTVTAKTVQLCCRQSLGIH